MTTGPRVFPWNRSRGGATVVSRTNNGRSAPVSDSRVHLGGPSGSEWRRRAGLALFSTLLLAGPGRAAPPASGEVVVFRTMMPECGPSSFAVALGPELGFSFDPGRGGVNYVWRGEFVDLGPTWKAKINKPADLRGAIVYRENVRYPLHLGTSGREPTFEFKGYALLPGAVEFHYLLDGVLVREEIRATPKGRGLVRRFQVSKPVGGWSYQVEPQPGVTISSPGSTWNEARTALAGPGGQEFSLTIELTEPKP